MFDFTKKIPKQCLKKIQHVTLVIVMNYSWRTTEKARQTFIDRANALKAFTGLTDLDICIGHNGAYFWDIQYCTPELGEDDVCCLFRAFTMHDGCRITFRAEDKSAIEAELAGLCGIKEKNWLC